jgi:hypothetical protein
MAKKARNVSPAGLLMAPVIFVTLLPFLVLSWSSPLFRGRLKALLNLESQKPASR